MVHLDRRYKNYDFDRTVKRITNTVQLLNKFFNAIDVLLHVFTDRNEQDRSCITHRIGTDRNRLREVPCLELLEHHLLRYNERSYSTQSVVL